MVRSLSLTSRLTLFFTALAATVVLALGWIFMAAADQHFMELDSLTLQDKQHLIEEVLSRARSEDDARARLEEVLGHHHGLSATVRTPSGVPLFQSRDIGVPIQVPPIANQHDHAVLQAGGTDGRALRVLRFLAAAGYDRESFLDVTLVMDTVHHAQFLVDLQRRLTAYAVLATVLSAMLGWMAARQGLAPLRAMKNRAAGVTAHQLGERMAVDAVPVEMAELARELNHMLERLQRDFTRLQEFSSDLAHELRTPISNLLTQTQVTLSSTRDAATYRDILASNAEELQRMARMVSDMLFLAKTERGVDLPHKERFSAAHEVQALVEFYEGVAEEKHVVLRAQGEGTIDGDRLMFRRAVSNLLSNALRHTPPGGDVHVRITETEDSIEIAVENTGADIDPQALPRLFDRFYRVDRARTHTPSEGAGLGLSITKAIVEAHGGRVLVESGGGRTIFRLVFSARLRPLQEPQRLGARGPDGTATRWE